MSRLEGDLKAEVVKFLNQSGLLYRRMNSGLVKARGGYVNLGPEGTADLLIFKGAHPMWIELKGTGQVTAKKRVAAQKAFADEVTALGHSHAQCERMEEVLAFLGVL